MGQTIRFSGKTEEVSKTRRALITGITGYIGSHLAKALLPDHEVYGLVRMPLHTEYIADFQDELHLFPVDDTYESVHAALEEICPDLVYHLATYYTGAHDAQTVPKLIASNVTFGAYLLEAMAACGVPTLVYAATVMAHYNSEPFRPLNLYAATKQAFSDLMAYYTDAGFFRAATLILSDTYGPGDHRPKVLNLIRNAARKNEAITLSDGGQDYDVVYIDDVVRAFRMAGEQLLQKTEWNNETFQVCSLKPLTLRQTVERMLEVNHMALNADWGGRPCPEREIRQAIRLYTPVPGWTQEVALEDGLVCFGSDA